MWIAAQEISRAPITSRASIVNTRWLRFPLMAARIRCRAHAETKRRGKVHLNRRKRCRSRCCQNQIELGKLDLRASAERSSRPRNDRGRHKVGREASIDRARSSEERGPGKCRTGWCCSASTDAADSRRGFPAPRRCGRIDDKSEGFLSGRLPSCTPIEMRLSAERREPSEHPSANNCSRHAKGRWRPVAGSKCSSAWRRFLRDCTRSAAPDESDRDARRPWMPNGMDTRCARRIQPSRGQRNQLHTARRWCSRSLAPPIARPAVRPAPKRKVTCSYSIPIAGE